MPLQGDHRYKVLMQIDEDEPFLQPKLENLPVLKKRDMLPLKIVEDKNKKSKNDISSLLGLLFSTKKGYQLCSQAPLVKKDVECLLTPKIPHPMEELLVPPLKQVDCLFPDVQSSEGSLSKLNKGESNDETSPLLESHQTSKIVYQVLKDEDKPFLLSNPGCLLVSKITKEESYNQNFMETEGDNTKKLENKDVHAPETTSCQNIAMQVLTLRKVGEQSQISKVNEKSNTDIRDEESSEENNPLLKSFSYNMEKEKEPNHV